MDLSEKIKQILATKRISPSHFADEIGIQRSSMSHILAGRNKPSLDIVQKIIKRFPDLGMAWILDDEDLPSNIQQEPIPVRPEQVEKKAPVQPLAAPSDEPRPGNTTEDVKRPTESAPAQPVIPAHKQVERVIIFYTDGTLQDYRP
jgi:DNA-binding XRE family transcriptional regulator